MAVDDRQKRLSMLNMHDGSSVWLLSDPNTSGVDAAERQTFLDCYRGIAFATPGGPTGWGQLLGQYRNRLVRP